MNQPDFQSIRNIRDNALLLSIANEYFGEDVYLVKIGDEIKENLSILKDDIKSLKKLFPGKFAVEINTDKIMESFENTAESMLSGGDEIKSDCFSGKLGTSLSEDIIKITEAIDNIWEQVKGSNIKYTAADSLTGFFDRMNIFSAINIVFSIVTKVLLIIFIVALAGFFYLFVTMEKEETVLKENRKITAFIEDTKTRLEDLEKKKAEAQESLKSHDDGELLRKDRIAILDIETRIQAINQEIHVIEGEIETRKKSLAKNNERIEQIKDKSFLDRLLKR